jgi:hypothetical protein
MNPEDLHTPDTKAEALLTAIANLLECFGSMEGTWYRRSWRNYGISEEMEETMARAWEKKYGTHDDT